MINQLTILDRIARKATKEALKKFTPLESEYSKNGITLEDLYNKAVENEFAILEKGLKLKPKLDELLTKYNISTIKEKLNGNYFWITLRPNNDHKHRFAEFKNLVTNNYINRAMFLSTKYCWEQKGETKETMGEGYHIHILAECKPGIMKPQLIRDTKRTFKKFLHGEVPDAFVDIEYVRTIEHINNIKAYMSGYKSDDWKEPACEMDKTWRKLYNLEDLYGDLNLDSVAPRPMATE